MTETDDFDYSGWAEQKGIECAGKAHDCGIGALTEPERLVFLIHQLVGEVGNGGVEQFFSNSSGAFALQTVDALWIVGAPKTAKRLAALNGLFPGGQPSTDGGKRDGELDAVLERHDDDLRSFDKFLMGSDENDYRTEEDLYLLLYRHVMKK